MAAPVPPVKSPVVTLDLSAVDTTKFLGRELMALNTRRGEDQWHLGNFQKVATVFSWLLMTITVIPAVIAGIVEVVCRLTGRVSPITQLWHRGDVNREAGDVLIRAKKIYNAEVSGFKETLKDAKPATGTFGYGIGNAIVNMIGSNQSWTNGQIEECKPLIAHYKAWEGQLIVAGQELVAAEKTTDDQGNAVTPDADKVAGLKETVARAQVNMAFLWTMMNSDYSFRVPMRAEFTGNLEDICQAQTYDVVMTPAVTEQVNGVEVVKVPAVTERVQGMEFRSSNADGFVRHSFAELSAKAWGFQDDKTLNATAYAAVEAAVKAHIAAEKAAAAAVVAPKA